MRNFESNNCAHTHAHTYAAISIYIFTVYKHEKMVVSMALFSVGRNIIHFENAFWKFPLFAYL